MKTALLLPYEFREVFAALTNEQAGELIKAIFDYEINGTKPAFDGVLLFAWASHIQPKLDKLAESYATKCEKNRANIAKRWQKDTTVYDRIPTDTKNTDAEADAEAEAKKKTVSDETAKEGATASFDLFDLPASLNCREFLDKWQEWLDYRKSVKKKVSALAAKKQINFLSQYDLATALSVIDQSIANDWQGLFPPGKANSDNSRVGATAVSPEQDEQRRQKRVAELREFRESLGIVDPFEQAEG